MSAAALRNVSTLIYDVRYRDIVLTFHVLRPQVWHVVSIHASTGTYDISPAIVVFDKWKIRSISCEVFESK